MRVFIPILLLAFSFGPARADIRPEHSGAWYNADQSGHGLSVQVLDDERTVAFWFAYTPGGLPMFLVIDGVNDFHTVTGPAYFHEGMIWGQFDPATLNQAVWGEVTIEFLGCDSAVLTWFSTIEGYGDGRIQLERLTYLAGLECDEVPAELTGDWQVEFAETDEGPYPVTVDADGTFEFYDAMACLWEGHIHVKSLARGDLTARFGSPTCPWTVPMLFAGGHYYAEGVTFCSSGGSCVHYDQAIALTSEWYEGQAIGLTFLR